MILREKECALNACVQIFCMTVHIISVHAVSLNISGFSKKVNVPVCDLGTKAQLMRILKKKCRQINYTQSNLNNYHLITCFPKLNYVLSN